MDERRKDGKGKGERGKRGRGEAGVLTLMKVLRGEGVQEGVKERGKERQKAEGWNIASSEDSK